MSRIHFLTKLATHCARVRKCLVLEHLSLDQSASYLQFFMTAFHDDAILSRLLRDYEQTFLTALSASEVLALATCWPRQACFCTPYWLPWGFEVYLEVLFHSCYYLLSWPGLCACSGLCHGVPPRSVVRYAIRCFLASHHHKVTCLLWWLGRPSCALTCNWSHFEGILQNSCQD